MRAIHKNPEPQSLTEHRCTPHCDYDNYQSKEDLRRNLVNEQGALCCYCMRRIAPTEAHMKIEHWHCQEYHEDEQLDYANLLGACLGGQGKPRKHQHCDTHKGNLALSRNPAAAHPLVDRDLRYLADGTIRCSDTRFDSELDSVLNLNVAALKNNRKAVLDALKEWAERAGSLRKAHVQRELREWSTINDNALKEYAGVATYWLKKRLRRCPA